MRLVVLFSQQKGNCLGNVPSISLNLTERVNRKLPGAEPLEKDFPVPKLNIACFALYPEFDFQDSSFPVTCDEKRILSTNHRCAALQRLSPIPGRTWTRYVYAAGLLRQIWSLYNGASACRMRQKVPDTLSSHFWTNCGPLTRLLFILRIGGTMASQPNPDSETPVATGTDPASAGQTQGTVLLSEIPEASAFTDAEPAGPTGADPNLRSGALAALGQRYDILAEAGRGNMGSVYKARDRETQQIVALKIVKPELASDQTMLERFKNELLFARRITHKSVCRVYEFNRIGGVAYTSMEFVQGESLRSVLNRFGGLPLRKAIDLVLQICSGLKEAHAQGIVHRDLKPENVMIDSNGNVKIMDFGIARCMESASGLTGALMGTPAYMAPEQVSGKPVDYRTDIYSLGLVLYEIFTGKQAFTADNPVAVALKQTQETPIPPHEIEPTVPVSVERAILKCLEKDPAKRFQSIAELESALKSSGTRAVLASSNAVAAMIAKRSATELQPAPSSALAAQAASKRASAFIWLALAASFIIFAGATRHWIAVSQAIKNLPPPSRLAAPVPPSFAFEKRLAPKATSIPQQPSFPKAQPSSDDQLAGRSQSAPEMSAVPASTTANAYRVQSPAEASIPANPSRAERFSSNRDTSAALLNSSGTTYLWIGRFELQTRAQQTAKQIQDAGLPTVIVPRRNPNDEFFVVLSGPLGPEKVAGAMQQLESLGFTNLRPIKNLILEQTLKP